MTVGSVAETVSSIVGMIYDCAVDQDRYQLALDAIRSTLRFHNAALQLWTADYEPLVNIEVGVPPEWQVRWPGFNDDVVALWGGPVRIAQFPVEEPIVHSLTFDSVATAANRYFTDWAKPQGIVDAVALAYVRDSQLMGSLGFGLHRSAGKPTEDELSILRILAPHFRRAALIGRLLDLRALQAKTFAAALDVLATPVIFIDRHLRVVHANDRGNRLLSAQRLIATRQRAVILPDAAAQMQLAEAVAIADADEARLGRKGIGIPARCRDGEPFVVHLLPVARGDARADLVTGAVVALFIAPSHDPQPPPIDALATLYGLTAAETRVVTLLARTMPLADIARTLGITRATVNTHLARLFANTETCRQTELIALVQSFRAPV